MELDEFKEQWNIRMDLEVARSHDDKTNNLYMNISETMNNLDRQTHQWWKWTRHAVQFLFGVVAFGIFLMIVLPPEATSIRKSLPAFVVYSVAAAIGLWLSEVKKRIFQPTDVLDLKTNISSALSRFRRWYIMSTVAGFLILPVVSYMAMSSVGETFGYTLAAGMKIAIAAGLTIVCTGLTHVYYKKNYFLSIESLKRQLNELE